MVSVSFSLLMSHCLYYCMNSWFFDDTNKINHGTMFQDWDQVSGYSTHSVQRHNRMYSMDQPPTLIADDMRSHFSTKGTKPRSIADGQSQNSFSNHSGRYLNAFPSNLITSRQGKLSVKLCAYYNYYYRFASIQTVFNNAIG